MSIIKASEEITTIIYADGSCEIYRRNDFNSPYQFRGDSVTRWHKWLHILETADKYPSLNEAITDVEMLYELAKDQ